jgi:predicted DNA-binding transcriptional regulator YafY
VRASRLVNLLLLLQARGGRTAADLAGELEVSVRTVYRDVEALAQAGVPIYAERGPGGGVRLVDGYRTRLTGLTTDEAEALFLSGLPGPAAELGLGTVVAAARLKVMAALPPELRTRASRIAERFHLDAPGWFKEAEPVPCLADLARAVWEDRRVTLRYRRGARVERRQVAPLGLVLKGGAWYVVAGSDGTVKTFRVARIEEAAVSEERFARPDRFDLAAHWAESARRFEQQRDGIDVIVRIDPEALPRLREAITEVAFATSRVHAPADPDGWVQMRLRIETVEWAIADLLRLGGEVEVLSPPEVRRGVADRARAIVARYPTVPDAVPVG